MKYSAFLKWWLLFTIVVVGTIFAHYIELFKNLWEKDASYLGFTTIVIFYITSIICGIQLFKLGKNSDDLQCFERQEELGWFMSEICLNLGMLGTIIGFVMMLSGFESLDITKTQTVQALLAELGRSMATALYTTLVGLLCGQLLKIQYFIMSLELQKRGLHERLDTNSSLLSTTIEENT